MASVVLTTSLANKQNNNKWLHHKPTTVKSHQPIVSLVCLPIYLLPHQRERRPHLKEKMDRSPISLKQVSLHGPLMEETQALTLAVILLPENGNPEDF